RVIEFAGIGPCPLAGMLLADMGADVIVIDRAPAKPGAPRNAMNRGKRSIALDLKSEADRDIAWQLLDTADALIEGFRPGVLERLGFSPDAVAARNPRLVFGRVTGWGQHGPLSRAAGHDLNYVALTGVSSIAARRGDAPRLPVTMVGDMGGGAMFLAFGVVCALFEAQRSGRGQVIDAAMVDGVAALSSLVHAMRADGSWSDDPARNLFLHQAPFFDAFECADGQFITLGAMEPPFYAELLRRLGLDDVDPARQYRYEDWPALRERIEALIRSQPRAHWQARLEGSDACFAPLLSFDEAAEHPHLKARQTFARVDGHLQPAAAPRFSRSANRPAGAGTRADEHRAEILAQLRAHAQAR
ncbi:MAG TPA: CaiB/BaiF CoA-transferase family protein, partial [Usitatibacteraceae bacterium]|nr:CaiB/BaiF CoA-transferase family protein [Usitatibacteraceae bacterium]